LVLMVAGVEARRVCRGRHCGLLVRRERGCDGRSLVFLARRRSGRDRALRRRRPTVHGMALLVGKTGVVEVLRGRMLEEQRWVVEAEVQRA
jgi:hypothetical protein